MTVKQFFRSTAFKSILVLLLITLVCGTILAIANDVFYISPEERLQRAVKKIYGEEKKAEQLEIKDVSAIKDIGSIQEIYLVEDGNYLIKATGLNGFNGGTVTVWIKADTKDKKFAGIDKVIEAGNTKQTLMSMFDASFYGRYKEHNDKIAKGDLFYTSKQENGIENIVTGATYSARAINNAVNSAILYLRIVINGESIESLPYSNLVKNVTTSINGKEVTFNLTALSTGASNDYPMVVVVNENGLKSVTYTSGATGSDYASKEWTKEYLNTLVGKKEADLKLLATDGSINTGATSSNKSLLNGMLYAVANYDTVLQGGGN